MIKNTVLLIHGIPVNCIFNISNRTASRFSISYGEIHMTISNRKPMPLIKYTLEKSIPKEKLLQMDTTPLIGEDYIYILGEKKRLLKAGNELVTREDITYVNYDELIHKLESFAKDIITSRVRYYEGIMGINKPYQVKITHLISANGKNYYTKGLLTFPYKLIHFSKEIIDAVVIHELAHYYQQNHSKAFYEIVYHYCPNYDVLTKKLNWGIRK